LRIEGLEVFHVALPLEHPWRTAYGEDSAIHSVLVRMVSDVYEGWGEATPYFAPTYSSETATSAFFLISEVFAARLVGQDLDTAEDLLASLRQFKGNPMAKAALESAWWMLAAATVRQPLHRLLGGQTRSVEAGEDFGVEDSHDVLLEKIERAIQRGFTRVKLKVRPGWDLDMLRVVRSAYPHLVLHIDCNAGYSLDDISLFRAIDSLDLAMIEQPLPETDLFGHAELQRQIGTPICLDESVKSIADFEVALRLGSCQALNIKYGRVGGLSTAVRLHNAAHNAGVLCWVGGMLESAIGARINIELATLPHFTYPGDLFESRRFYHTDLTEPGIEMNADCTFTPVTEPEATPKPDPNRLREVTVRMASAGRLR
jgi:O-succinylbenzoate synthase